MLEPIHDGYRNWLKKDYVVSAEELMRLTLARIAAVNGDVNAIVALRDSDELLAEARAADAAPSRDVPPVLLD